MIQLAANGKGRLVPVAIMVDGKFFDAGSYKAIPVPMALDFGVVYEGFRTGVSQGIFTITQPGQLAHNWIAQGTWLPAGAKAPETHKKAEMPVIEEKDAPPKLHRRDKPGSDSGDQQKPPAPPASPSAAPPGSAPKPPDAAKAPPAEPETIDDPNRPVLRRGAPGVVTKRELVKIFDEPEATAKLTGKPAKDSAVSPIQFIPAISDAGGPDPRPYTFDMKPPEEASYRKKMLQLAGELFAKTKTGNEPVNPSGSTHAKSRLPSASKTAQPAFEDVRLRVFDLTTSNSPVLILSAKTRAATSGNAQSELEQQITLVARTNLEGDLHKLFFSVTDAQHLDIAPQMELIDAMDADGDGRGELLFRRTFDTGSSYAIYRATADQLWPLYEGTP